MEEDLEKILEALDNLQTQLQLFKICTFHKITHIVVAEVLFNDKLPNNWYLWDSPITNSIANIYSNFMAKLTNRSLLPPYALHISSMSTNKWGLGLSHPIYMATPMLNLRLKIYIGYSTPKGKGPGYLGNTIPPVPLPNSIPSLFRNWRSLQ